MTTVEINVPKHLAEMHRLKNEYPNEIQFYAKTAMHMEDTESCMITLPCSNRGKKLMILVADIS